MKRIGMQVSRLTLLAAIGAAIYVGSAARGQSPGDELQPLVRTSVRRLLIAEQVALAKWDSGDAVEDSARETQVIASAVKEGESQGLDRNLVASFFRAQIEANKLVQFSLLADWRRAGKAPAHTAVSLVNTIRPELDEVQRELIAELAATGRIRGSKTCRSDVARAIGKYVTAHKRDAGALHAIALDRALAATCTP